MSSYVTLPSNVSQDVFKNNTSSSYRVNLAQNIDLDGAWQVALTEISYSHTWYNVPQETDFFDWRRRPAERGDGAEMRAEDQRVRFKSGHTLEGSWNHFLEKFILIFIRGLAWFRRD